MYQYPYIPSYYLYLWSEYTILVTKEKYKL